MGDAQLSLQPQIEPHKGNRIVYKNIFFRPERLPYRDHCLSGSAVIIVKPACQKIFIYGNAFYM